jgi:hypothetical protein
MFENYLTPFSPFGIPNMPTKPKLDYSKVLQEAELIVGLCIVVPEDRAAKWDIGPWTEDHDTMASSLMYLVRNIGKGYIKDEWDV